MKKLLTLLLALAMAFAFAACIGEDGQEPSVNDDEISDTQQQETTNPDEDASQNDDEQMQGNTDGEISLDNVTDSNYADIAKELFGIEVDPGEGWELVKADSTGTIAGGLAIIYQGSATVDSKEMMKAYYDATAAVSTAGICIGVADDNSSTGLSISEPFADFDAFFEEGTKANGSVGEWIYEFGGKKIEFMFALSSEMELTLQINFVADHIYG